MRTANLLATLASAAMVAPLSHGFISAQIEYDLNNHPSSGDLGGAGAVNGLDITGADVSGTPVFNLGASTGGNRVDLISSTASLSIPDAPGVTSLTMTPTIGAMNPSWATPSVGDTTQAGGNPTPGFGAGGEIGMAPPAGPDFREVSITFDQSILLTEINGNWWDASFGTDGPPAEDLQINLNGQSWNIPPASANGWSTTATSGLATATINGITGILVNAGSPIEFTVNDANGNGILEANGLIEGIRLHVVPEPTRGLLLLAAGALIVLRRRR